MEFSDKLVPFQFMVMHDLFIFFLIKILGSKVFSNPDMVIKDVDRHEILCYAPILGLQQQLIMTASAV